MQEKLYGELTSLNILVFGWFGHNNIGDNLFCEAFQELFPNLNFTFSDKFTVDNAKNASAIFIGGGSFLYSDPLLSEECLNIIKTKDIFYIGVGPETSIHPLHKELIRLARLIAVRSPINIDNIKELNNNTIIIPDIVYSLKYNSKYKKKNKNVLILPNIYTVPQNIDSHWKHNSWNNFKFEFSQFLDYLIENEFNINFFAMCKNINNSDSMAAYEIINSMKYRNENYLIDINNYNFKNINKLFIKYDAIISQRFHGTVLSEIFNIPCLTISHHDKLNNSFYNKGKFISYYSSFKKIFIDEFNLVIKTKLHNNIAIQSDIFADLKDTVNSILFKG